MEEESVLHLLQKYWLVLVKHAKLFSWILAGTFLIFAYMGLHAAKVYEAKTTFYFPLQSSGGSVSALSQSVLGKGGGGAADSLFSALLPVRPVGLQDYTSGVLESRRVADMLIDRFHLLDYYHTRLRSVAADALHRTTQITLSPEGIMEIKVKAGSPQMAADLANGYVDAYREYSSTSTVSIAKKHRLNVEQQLAELQGKLSQAEKDMAGFQGRYKTEDFPAEAKGMIRSLFDLRMQKMAAEVEKKAGERKIKQSIALAVRNLRYASKDPVLAPSMDDPVLMNLRDQLAGVYVKYSQAKATETRANPERESYRQQMQNLQASLRGQLRREIKAHSRGVSSDLLNLELATEWSDAKAQAYQNAIARMEKAVESYPNIGLQYERKAQKLKILEALNLFLSSEREKAILQEAKESPDFEVLDKALPPDFKSGTGLRIYLMAGLMLGLALGFLGTIAADYFLSSGSALSFFKPNLDGHEDTERLKVPL